MPYKRFRRTRKRTFRGRKKSRYSLFKPKTWPRDMLGMRWPWNTRTISRAALSTVNSLKSNLNVEYKVFDVSASGNLDYGSPVQNHLNPLAAGDGGDNRNGNSVRFKSLIINGTVKKHASDSSTATWVRIVICNVISMPSTTAPTLAQLYSSSNIFSLRNLENTKNLKVFKVVDIQLNQNTVVDKKFLIKIPLNLKTKWNSNFHATIPKENSLYMIAWGVGFSSTNYPTYNCQARLRYVDN